MSSGSGVPPFYAFVRDRTGQSEVVGVVLVLGIAAIGVTAVVVLGAGAIADTERTSHVERAAHGMTQLDSRIAEVGLGDSSAQRTYLGDGGEGSYDVEDDSGWIRITQFNYTEEKDPRNETIYNASLGSVNYENGDTTIAYQGGGVWRTRDGGTTMVSPPEFHYRAATLTLPVLRVDGTGSGSNVDAHVTPDGRAERVFPDFESDPDGDDEIGAPYNETGEPYLNPVENGRVNVTVHSDHYQGWASYFRERTEGDVSVDHDEETATVELLTIGTIDEFGDLRDGRSVPIRGIPDTHVVDNFTLRLRPNPDVGRGFNALSWSMFADTSEGDYEFHVEGKDFSCDSPTTAELTVYFRPSGTDNYHGWHNGSIGEMTCSDLDDDGEDEKHLDLNLSSGEQMQYTDTNNLLGVDTRGELMDEAVFDEHPGGTLYDDDPANDVFDPEDNNEAPLGQLTNHYFALLGPDFDLEITKDNQGGGNGGGNGPGNGPGGGSDRIDPDTSWGYMGIDGTGDQFITYLQVTENRVEVELE